MSCVDHLGTRTVNKTRKPCGRHAGRMRHEGPHRDALPYSIARWSEEEKDNKLELQSRYSHRDQQLGISRRESAQKKSKETLSITDNDELKDGIYQADNIFINGVYVEKRKIWGSSF